jgi:hypothetical protein
MGRISSFLTVVVFALFGLSKGVFSRQQTQQLSLPPSLSSYLSKQAIVRAAVRLGQTDPERWFAAYDQGTQARVALFEGSMMTDDKAFEKNRDFGHKLSLQNLQSISVPNANASFLLSFDEDGNKTTKYFCVVTFAPGALDIKLFVTTVSGKAEVFDNPFRVKIWSKLPSVGARGERYTIAEYRLPSVNATKLVKAAQETKSPE